MARITATDCLDQVDNRFQLVLIAARRARQLIFGSPPLVEDHGEKPTVLALREIAAGEVGPEILEEEVMLPGFTQIGGAEPEERFPEFAEFAEDAATEETESAAEDSSDTASAEAAPDDTPAEDAAEAPAEDVAPEADAPDEATDEDDASAAAASAPEDAEAEKTPD